MEVEPRQIRAAKARLRSSDLILGTMGRQCPGTQADLLFTDGETEAWGRGIHLLKIKADKAEPGCALTSVQPPSLDVNSRGSCSVRGLRLPTLFHRPELTSSWEAGVSQGI